jgi:hypothetical protein
VDRFWNGSFLEWIVSGMDRLWNGSALEWIVSGILSSFLPPRRYPLEFLRRHDQQGGGPFARAPAVGSRLTSQISSRFIR